jgi:hypothetical protein
MATWNRGQCNGLWVEVVSDSGRVLRAATPDDAAQMCLLLNHLESEAAFGQQCYQDSCENAYIHATVVKRIVSHMLTLHALGDSAATTELVEGLKAFLRTPSEVILDGLATDTVIAGLREENERLAKVVNAKDAGTLTELLDQELTTTAGLREENERLKLRCEWPCRTCSKCLAALTAAAPVASTPLVPSREGGSTRT